MKDQVNARKIKPSAVYSARARTKMATISRNITERAVEGDEPHGRGRFSLAGGPILFHVM
jgi:hypothetical protein